MWVAFRLSTLCSTVMSVGRASSLFGARHVPASAYAPSLWRAREASSLSLARLRCCGLSEPRTHNSECAAALARLRDTWQSGVRTVNTRSHFSNTVETSVSDALFILLQLSGFQGFPGRLRASEWSSYLCNDYPTYFLLLIPFIFRLFRVEIPFPFSFFFFPAVRSFDDMALLPSVRHPAFSCATASERTTWPAAVLVAMLWFGVSLPMLSPFRAFPLL